MMQNRKHYDIDRVVLNGQAMTEKADGGSCNNAFNWSIVCDQKASNAFQRGTVNSLQV
jgi:hypothetical protein